MRLPSFKTVTQSATYTLFRFPAPLVFAFIGTALSIYMIELNDYTLKGWMVRLLFTCFIGLPCMLGCALYAERVESKLQKAGVTIIGLALVALYWLWFAPDEHFEDVKLIMVFSVLNICMHLWVSVAAYIGRSEKAGFWKFNEELFIRIILSAIFSGVLFAGLAIAIVSVDELFKLDIDDMIYPKLYFFVVGVFNTWFFLSGVPKNYEELDEEAVFPKWLKVFTQYILIPLTILYLLILYAYGLKILIEWSLPKGWVSMLVMCYSLVGVLAILLVYPLRESTENAWVKLFARFFFIAIMPLIVLLFVAIGARIGDYGITEPRYYLMMLGCWLAFIAIYFTISKQKSIKLIPVSLLVLGLLSLVGPWSVFSVSANSQKGRLEQILAKYDMIDAQKAIVAPKSEMGKDDAGEIREIVGYMVDNGHTGALSDLLKTDVALLTDSAFSKYDSRWTANSNLEDTVLALMHIDSHEAVERYSYYNFTTNKEAFDVAGFSKAYSIEHVYLNRKNSYKFDIGDSVMMNINYDPEVRELSFVNEQDEILTKVNIGTMLERLIERGNATPCSVDELTVVAEGELRIKMVIHEVSIDVKKKEMILSNLTADLLFE